MTLTLICCTDCALWSPNAGFMYSHKEQTKHNLQEVKLQWVEERK